MNVLYNKVAIVCDWLTARGWAEKVILDLVKIFPEADIYTSIFEEKNFPELKGKPVICSYLQRLPSIVRKHTLLMPFYPKAFESFNFDKYDLVISSSHNVSKWLITLPSTKHICYCHTPVRALWSDHTMFINDPRYKVIPKWLLSKLLHGLRIIDYIQAQRPDHYISNSNYISQRIKKFYQRDSQAIYPACFIKTSNNYKKQLWKYFLTISRLVPTKKNDILITAFNEMPDKKLKIYWSWSEYNRLKLLIKWDNIEIIEWSWNDKTLEEKERIFSEAIAFIHPQKEDFWMTPIEAQSFGLPVIAYFEWWAQETVKDWVTGTLFRSCTPEEIIKTINNFNPSNYRYQDMINWAENFSFDNFKSKTLEFISRL